MHHVAFGNQESWADVFKKKLDLLKWVVAFSIDIGRGGPINTDKFTGHSFSVIGESRFEDLEKGESRKKIIVG